MDCFFVSSNYVQNIYKQIQQHFDRQKPTYNRIFITL